LEDLLESQQNTWNMRVQKIESDKNDLLDKKEKIFSHEVENMKLQFLEEKEQLKENVNKLSTEKEQITQENLKLRDQIISERLEERKEIKLLKDQMRSDKQEAIRELEKKVKCISEVKVEVEERMRNQSLRLNDTLEDNMKLTVEMDKNELKQREMEQLLQQHDSDIKASVSEMEQKLLKKEEEILTKNNKLHSATKKIESDHKRWTALEKQLKCEINEQKSSLNKSNARLKEKDEMLKKIR
jgi:hypothetical protein